MSERESAIQREIHQTKPFRTRSQEGVVALLRTADVVRRYIGRVLEPHGVTTQQFNVLRILRGAGPEGLPTLAISERMIEEAPGITRLLDRLEAKGLVRRERCPGDRRQVLCYATPEALELLGRIDGEMDQADEMGLGMLSEEDKVEMIRLLDAVRAGHQ
ncbi:MAG TPA: MarR family transcriptional regulator [Thermoanaerobaculia bacterium]|nr:MarR family transcriptional regulator [Thermoanaerobaculia bacterium]